jgi:hypothetical protein
VLLVAGCKDSAGPDENGGSNAIFAASGPLSSLYRVPLQATGVDSLIGAIRTASGEQLSITDIAVAPNGELWGVTFAELYRIDARTAVATRIGFLGALDVNAITFAPDGRLTGAGATGTVYVINTVTAAAQAIGTYGAGMISGGDLAYAPDGTLYATVFGPNGLDRLVTVNPATGVATPAGTAANIGHGNVWGLVFVGDRMYGLTYGGSNGVLLRIDRSTGAGTQVRALTFNTYGATKRRGPVLD